MSGSPLHGSESQPRRKIEKTVTQRLIQLRHIADRVGNSSARPIAATRLQAYLSAQLIAGQRATDASPIRTSRGPGAQINDARIVLRCRTGLHAPRYVQFARGLEQRGVEFGQSAAYCLVELIGDGPQATHQPDIRLQDRQLGGPRASENPALRLDNRPSGAFDLSTLAGSPRLYFPP